MQLSVDVAPQEQSAPMKLGDQGGQATVPDEPIHTLERACNIYIWAHGTWFYRRAMVNWLFKSTT